MPHRTLTDSQIELIRTNLPDEVREWLENPHLVEDTLSSMSLDQRAELHDAALNALLNGGPIVRSYTAEQDKGPYPVWIAGVEGAYMLMALEHDTLGPFDTLFEAVDAMEKNYGEFLVK